MISRRTLLTGAAGVVILTGCGGTTDVASVSGDDDGYHGTMLEDGYEIPDVEFTDQYGESYNLRNTPDTPAVALFFGYTNCPDVCPGILADMASARRRLPEEAANQLTLILVSTDPARDTPEVLRSYLERIDESFIGLTAELAQTVEVASSLGIAIEEGKQLPSGGYEVDHSTPILGVTGDRRVKVVWTEGISIGDLGSDYERLIADSA